MVKVTVSFKGELNELLPVGKKGNLQEISYPGKRSVKDLVESCEIPHTEIGTITINGHVVELSTILKDGDKIDVHPADNRLRQYGRENLDNQDKNGTRENPDTPGNRRKQDTEPQDDQAGCCFTAAADGHGPLFICDEHLWKLARRLRLLGFDTAFDKQWDDPDLAAISAAQGRILLTRDRGLLMRKKVTRGLLIRSTNPEEQVIEVLHRLDLGDRCKPFTRCLHCSGFLKKVRAGDDNFAAVASAVPPLVNSWCKEYDICRDCRQIYWKGSHYEKLVEKVKGYTGKIDI